MNEKKLKKIFKVDGKNLTDEEKYDKIMYEARNIFKYRDEDLNDPYSFQKAFEWALRQIREENLEKFI